MNNIEDDGFRLSLKQRELLLLELERWMFDCERKGNELFDGGASGHIADQMTLTMRIDDDGFHIEASRSRSVEIGP